MEVILESERLRLRPFRIGDAQAMFDAWASDPEVTKYLTWETHTDVSVTRALLERWTKEYEKPERLNFAIERKADGKLIGGIDVVGYLDGPGGTPVIGYNLSRACWGQGYMTEACRRLLAFLFSRGHRAVRIDALRDNLASRRVIEKCGGKLIAEEEMEMKGRTVPVNRYLVSAPEPGRRMNHSEDPVAAFLNEKGQLRQMPAKEKKRAAVYEYLAGKIDPGRTYTEKEINDCLNAWHTFGDAATLRRELYDRKLLKRSSDGSVYEKA